MEDKARLDELMLDTAVLTAAVMRHLYKKGVIAVYPNTLVEFGTVQMTPDAFFATFPKYAVQKYESEDGYGRKAFTDYNGVRFFTLLDNDPVEKTPIKWEGDDV